jgi:4-hydroxy-tetrahydrodipicolinate reductase
MIRVAISGIPGRLATATAAAIAASDDLELVALYNPHRGGEAFNGIPISASHDEIECDVVFESTEPTVVMDNLRAWCEAGLHAVVATSGFTRERLDEVRSFWGEDGPGCLIAPNFSIGAVGRAPLHGHRGRGTTPPRQARCPVRDRHRDRSQDRCGRRFVP